MGSSLVEQRQISRTVTARIGLLGNPSTGFGGAAIAIPLPNFRCSAIVTPSSSGVIEISTLRDTVLGCSSLTDFVAAVDRFGYYGEDRLIRAAVRAFADLVPRDGQAMHSTFRIETRTDIPRQVGFAGSSAIVVACIQGLAQYFGVSMDKDEIALQSLWVETKRLGVSAGIMDRVVQVYEAPIFVDAKSVPAKTRVLRGCRWPDFFVSYDLRLAGESGATAHNDMHTRFDAGEREVVQTMTEIGACATEGLRALDAGQLTEFGRLMDRNFDLRERIYPISDGMKKMIEIGRRKGSNVKFAGSGGAVVGTYSGTKMLADLKEVYEAAGCAFAVVASPDSGCAPPMLRLS
jgi:glucuronokinase